MGKVLQLVLHPLELRAAITLKYIRQPVFPKDTKTSNRKDLKRCYELLGQTSRSFAAVIAELHPELRNAVALFYLILRALDTIEDDMTLSTEIKVPILRDFHETLQDTSSDWHFNDSGPNEKDRNVLVEFPCIQREFRLLRSEYRDVIARITKLMGNGMADYVLDKSFHARGLETVADYDKYCHYVAGLVGDGLTELFVIAGFAAPELHDVKHEPLYESMGLFLQKTNIIRDYAEDLADGRTFYPREIWSQYSDEISGLARDERAGVQCINHLVLDALRHARDVLFYLSHIQEQSCFQFCAIPQVMAVATLESVFNNPKVLKENVKIRKGTTCDLILEARTLQGCIQVFQRYLRAIKQQTPVDDPNYLKINIQVAQVEQFIEEMYQNKLPDGVEPTRTPVYQQAQARFRCDEAMLPTIVSEQRKFNIILGALCVFILAIVLS